MVGFVKWETLGKLERRFILEVRSQKPEAGWGPIVLCGPIVRFRSRPVVFDVATWVGTMAIVLLLSGPLLFGRKPCRAQLR